MGSRYNRKKMNMKGDRLSNLPDDLIHEILSFMEIKEAIKTSGLSSRWRYVWTSMPSLNLSYKDFHYLGEFSTFVTHVLSHLDNQTEVISAELNFCGTTSKSISKRILNYASSHNVQQLNITCIELPHSLLSSQSVKHLTLSGHTNRLSLKTPFTWELPALATLNLQHVVLYEDTCVGLLSKCANLKSLTLKNCIMRSGLNIFSLCHPGLSSLTLEHGSHGVNVVTPQLKNLTIKYWRGIHLVSAPNLSSLCYTHYYVFLMNKDGLWQLPYDLHLEKVDICISYPFEYANARKFVCLLQQLHSVEFLTLNLELVKLLSSCVELISHQPSPFTNLQTLKIYPYNVNTPEVSISAELKGYLLDGSPGATFTMVSHEEIKDVMNVTSTQNLMGEVEVLLDQWKETRVTNRAHMRKQFVKRYKGNIRRTISLLWEIEEVLTKVPASHRAKLQARFSGLCAEAKIMMDNAKIQRDKN